MPDRFLEVLAVTTAVLLLTGSPLAADEYVNSKSPDEKFALHVVREDKQPLPQSTALIERATRKVVVDLGTNQTFDPEAKLLWTSDSQRFAYLRCTEEENESAVTRVFQRNGGIRRSQTARSVTTENVQSGFRIRETTGAHQTHPVGRTPRRWSLNMKSSPTAVGAARKGFRSSRSPKSADDRQGRSGTGLNRRLFFVIAGQYAGDCAA